ncbi:DUF5317 family protein [Cellulomonas xylanilytica]|uniref:Uncharacterized protein n=1 Tax=Cellulomonas xylanilytica TaxID=233583 RepID=A0A510V4K9_9CELL|nr:DUF5317 family protein [Cellulomonas xylanilytica]GEK21812.1 hypothetical protein CXY01_23320 [Cellulomonas xylanilytica]
MESALVVVLLVVPVLAALVLVLRRGGLASLAHVRVRGAPWALTGAAVQALRSADPAWASGLLDAAGGALVPLALAVCAVGFAFANARGAGRGVRIALVVATVGALSNALATALNGGMPFSVPAARSVGLDVTGAPGHVPIDGSTVLVPLADLVPVPGVAMVFSVGDVLLWVGLAAVLVLAAAATRLPGGPAGAHHPPAAAPATAPTVTRSIL